VSNSKNMKHNVSQGKLLLYYFVIVFVLAIPFWIFGGEKLPLPINLPMSALGTFIPVTAAAILTYWQSGINGIKILLKKAVDYKKIKKVWYLPALLLPPLILFLSYVVMRLAKLPLPNSIQIPWLVAPLYFLIFFIGDAGEELGWSGYAIDPMQARWGALKASFTLGFIWAIWHIIPWIQTENPPNWILWQGISAIALRILIVWIYNNTGKSVFAAILIHDMSNLSEFLFPNYGSYYNPFIAGMITIGIVIIIVFRWGSKTLTRDQHALISRD
jgi:CAAX protease family protein